MKTLSTRSLLAVAAFLLMAAALPLAYAKGNKRADSDEEAVGLGVGYKLPAFTATDLNGATHRLRDYEGQVLVLHFWASWCPYCRSEIPELKELQSAWADKHVQVLAISTDSDAGKLRAFVKQQGLLYPIVADMSREVPIAEQYGIQGIPVTYVIGRDGKVIHRLQGASEIIKAVQDTLSRT